MTEAYRDEVATARERLALLLPTRREDLEACRSLDAMHDDLRVQITRGTILTALGASVHALALMVLPTLFRSDSPMPFRPLLSVVLLVGWVLVFLTTMILNEHFKRRRTLTETTFDTSDDPFVRLEVIDALPARIAMLHRAVASLSVRAARRSLMGNIPVLGVSLHLLVGLFFRVALRDMTEWIALGVAIAFVPNVWLLSRTNERVTAVTSEVISTHQNWAVAGLRASVIAAGFSFVSCVLGAVIIGKWESIVVGVVMLITLVTALAMLPLLYHSVFGRLEKQQRLLAQYTQHAQHAQDPQYLRTEEPLVG